MDMEPVWVWESIKMQRRLNTVEDAALFLLHKWPKEDQGSKLHIAAQIAVLEALEEKRPAGEARAAFVEAAERVQILAPGPMKSDVKLPGHVARPWDMPWAKKGKRRRR